MGPPRRDSRCVDFTDLLRRQTGLVLRGQALAAGLSKAAIRWKLERGEWQPVFSGLYATFTGVLTEEQRLIAASLYGGVGSQITGAAALRCYGVRYAPEDPHIQILVEWPTRRSSRGFVVVSRTTRLDQHSRPRGAYELCSVQRAGADAARAGYDLRTVRAFLADTVQRGFTTVAALAEELRSGPSTRSVVFRQVVGELTAGVRSAPEAELRDIVARSTVLPPVRWNPRLVAADGTRLPSTDGWIQKVGMALEADSQEFHASGDHWSRTLERHAVLATYGILTVHFTPRQMRDDPDKVLAVIERSYRGRPPGFSGVRAR